ncbi:hypothetical protein CesoFtcFv8_010553 [Champsocephalus esox]|uniref:Uncharacterized protein n=1 Tax=Champsocephalus esox TaxID=159716 RepID=A0AAN8C4T6_9TELE|nr:hypothetical protein CesoFtcFv8_010553 [Champsocephalus esox]
MLFRNRVPERLPLPPGDGRLSATRGRQALCLQGTAGSLPPGDGRLSATRGRQALCHQGTAGSLPPGDGRLSATRGRQALCQNDTEMYSASMGHVMGTSLHKQGSSNSCSSHQVLPQVLY